MNGLGEVPWYEVIGTQDRYVLDEENEVSNKELLVFRVPRSGFRVAAACRGPKAERARRREAKVAFETFGPTRRRDLSGGGTPLGKSAAVSGSRR